MSTVLSPQVQPQALGSSAKAQPPARAILALGVILALWFWLIWACAGYWRHFVQYSYGWFVPLLFFIFVHNRFATFRTDSEPSHPKATRNIFLILLLAVPLLEYIRLADPVSRAPVWVIYFFVAALTGAATYLTGGRSALLKAIFPLFFFATALPWFSAWESRATVALMKLVVAATAELLHWCNFLAEPQGALIKLSVGMVGVEEACSGIQSLQAGIMYALAMGELFALNFTRRIGLLFFTIAAAFLSNLLRVFVLCYQANVRGIAVVDELHNTIGTILALSLPLFVILGAKRLSKPVVKTATVPNKKWALGFLVPAPAFSLLVALAGILFWHGWIRYLDHSSIIQKKPYFALNAANGNLNKIPVPKLIWEALTPTDGTYFTFGRKLGTGSGYHFFWEPHWDNFNVLWHHPETCMVGAGWVLAKDPTFVSVKLDGIDTDWTIYVFKNGDDRLLQIWGAWRNGVSVSGNRRDIKSASKGWPAQGLFSSARSATEVVSCGFPFLAGQNAPIDEATAIISSLFRYSRATSK